MKILGLVTEYNPFHNGHLYHLNQSKIETDATHVVAVMSGNFLQRGAPALMNKWERSKIAVMNGVDLVIELPTVFAMNSADYFSYGAVSLLDNIGVVDTLCFGSESGHIDGFQAMSKTLIDEPLAYIQTLKDNLNTGLPFPKARELAIQSFLEDEGLPFTNLFTSPNNILGIEYVKSIMALDSTITPASIKRIESDYNSSDIDKVISSATAIRNTLLRSENDLNLIAHTVPEPTLTSLESYVTNGYNFIYSHDFSQMVLGKIRTTPKEVLREVHDVSEGLENRILNASYHTTSFNELVEAVATKRYTRTRIQRVLFNILFNINSSYVGKTGNLKPEYARILAFNNKGAEILKIMRKKSTIEVISNLTKKNYYNKAITDMLDFDLKASAIYNLAYDHPAYRVGQRDYTEKPYYHKEE